MLLKCSRYFFFLIFGLILFPGVASAAVLPDAGVDLADLILSGILALGVTASIASGGYVAYKIVKRGLLWASMVFSDPVTDDGVKWVAVRLSGNKTEYLRSWDADSQRVEGRLRRGKNGQLWRVS